MWFGPITICNNFINGGMFDYSICGDIVFNFTNCLILWRKLTQESEDFEATL